jgi:hypothetical protein
MADFFKSIDRAFKSIPPPKPLPPPKVISMQQFTDAFKVPPPKPLPKPISFNEFMGGVQSVTKVATSPARDLIETLAGATKDVTGGITSQISGLTDGLMLPLLIGGGVLLFILIRK